MNEKASEIFKSVKETASAILETSKEAAQQAGKKLEEKRRIMNLESQIKKTHAQMEGIFADIGRQMYEHRTSAHMESKPGLDQAIEHAYQSLDHLSQRIDDLTAQIHMPDDYISCPGCNRPCPHTYSYCPVCRTKLKN